MRRPDADRSATGGDRRTPLLAAARHRASTSAPVQALRRRRPRRPRRPGHRAGRRQRRRQVGADQVHRRHPRARRRRDPLGGPARCTSARPRDAAALGIETVHQDLALCDNLDIVQNMFLGRERAAARRCSTRRRWRQAAGETLAQPRGHDGALDPPAGRVAVRRPAAVGGDRQGRAVELEARDHGRADRRARRRPDDDGARPGAAARRPRPRRADRVPQHERRVRGRRPDRGAAPRPDGRGAARRPSSTARSSSTS